jgi:methyl coenzyme M reductase beta subunit
MTAFDLTHVSKSGKHTAGAGYSYSGCVGREKKGFRILCGIAALNLEAVQTMHDPKNGSILEY